MQFKRISRNITSACSKSIWRISKIFADRVFFSRIPHTRAQGRYECDYFARHAVVTLFVTLRTRLYAYTIARKRTLEWRTRRAAEYFEYIEVALGRTEGEGTGGEGDSEYRRECMHEPRVAMFNNNINTSCPRGWRAGGTEGSGVARGRGRGRTKIR